MLIWNDLKRFPSTNTQNNQWNIQFLLLMITIQYEVAYERRKTVYNCLNYPKISHLKVLNPLSIVFSQPKMVIIRQSFK